MEFHVYLFIFSILALALSTFNYGVLHMKIYHVSFLMATPNEGENLQDPNLKSSINKVIGGNREDNERDDGEDSGRDSERSDEEDDKGNSKEDDRGNDGDGEDEERCTSLDNGNISLISGSTVRSQSDSSSDEQFRNKLLSMNSLLDVRIICMQILSSLNSWERKKEEKSSILKQTYKILFRTEKYLESSGVGNTEVHNENESKVESSEVNKLHVRHQRILDKVESLQQRLEYIQSKVDRKLAELLICEEVALLFEEEEFKRKQASMEASSLLQSIFSSMTLEEKERAEANRELTRQRFFNEVK
ncbi:uncharacterized protein CMU_005310 [Cryptosporidium muris RN66]|uniref:Uncharacterized protein n=1 Tax=Cryptosporidium muris (strain RN66) TaxID=441375 RepID=B6AHB3_CRYMR|nr:uncharacterized protein CMU_005310 [Cryptosporidium muris RN66]EEA07608.1 hypothetical protein CMU_005310 [Cryptosporidium muris RN66]|eukprot:XP_002141957.1 hypothetical protein [Cryptosporidium muris RN66]